jgi:hypothetical protein
LRFLPFPSAAFFLSQIIITIITFAIFNIIFFSSKKKSI